LGRGQHNTNTNILFIMIDYIKLQILNINIVKLLNNKKLDFKTVVSESTGEISTKSVATFHYCKITVYDSGIIIFQGSIHKLFNSIKGIIATNYIKENYKGFNGNDFTLDNILEVKSLLCNLFDCKPKQMTFQNIEYGINCKLDINIDLFIKGLLYHKGIYFEHKFNRSYAEVKHQRYRIKIYNKGKQYQMQVNAIRLELSINKMEEIKDISINSFYDINTTTLNSLNKLLLKRLDEVSHYDYTIIGKELSKSNKRLINLYSDPNYWLHTLKPNKRYRQKKNLKKITDNHSDYIFDAIKKELVNKCSILNRLSKNDNCSIINYSNIELDKLQNSTRKCNVTGIDLHREKKDSNYIKTTTLKHLRKHDKYKYEEVCSLLLSNSNPNHTKFENNIISHLVKQIRNRFFNKNRIKNTGYNKKKYENQFKMLF
jgi:hypothetical protein